MATVFEQLMEKHNHILRQQESHPFYKMLLNLSENLIEVTKAINEIVGMDIKVLAVKNEAKEVEGILEEIEESYATILKQPYGDLIIKQTYEALDPLIVAMDDLIEDLNEYGEAQGKIIPYIEAWDIGFFYE